MIYRLLAAALGALALLAGLMFVIVLVTKITALGWASLTGLLLFGSIASAGALLAVRSWQHAGQR